MPRLTVEPLSVPLVSVSVAVESMLTGAASVDVLASSVVPELTVSVLGPFTVLPLSCSLVALVASAVLSTSVALEIATLPAPPNVPASRFTGVPAPPTAAPVKVSVRPVATFMAPEVEKLVPAPESDTDRLPLVTSIVPALVCTAPARPSDSG